jgi:hypothetical protein
MQVRRSNLGKQHSNIQKELVNELINDAITIYFFPLRDQYGDIVEYPNSCKISISISPAARYKKITYLEESKVPCSLVMLVKKIEKITNVAQWTGNI